MCKHSQPLMILTFIVLSLFYSTTFMSICTGIWKLPAILQKPNSMGLKMDNPLSKASADWLRVWPENRKAIPQIYVKNQKRRITAEGGHESGHWFLTQFHFNSLYVTTALLCGLLPNQQQHKRVAQRPIGCDTAPRWQKTATTKQPAKL